MATVHGKILRYTLLPGIIPRLSNLFTSGFAHVAFSIALVYRAVRLLPEGHPYLDQKNFGRFGLRHVIVEAANNLVFSRRNIDQILIFFTILGGIALLVAQIALAVVALLAHNPAFAAAFAPIVPTINNILGVTSIYGHGGVKPSQDIAFILLDRVFGLQGTGPETIFGSCISDPGVVCTDLNSNPVSDPGGAYPSPFHVALHTLLRFYSLGIFYVSVIVILYFITTIVGETAVTGSPFGQRFNKTWAPVRLILFFALLMPINTGNNNEGLNGAQLITFWTAKTGSNFATNAWGRFNQVLTTTPLGQEADLVATPNHPEVNNLVRFMFIAMTCKISEEYAYGHQPQPGNVYANPPEGVQAYVVRGEQTPPSPTGTNAMRLNGTPFATALTFTNSGNIQIAFGVRDSITYKNEKGEVKPLCGTVTIPVTAADTTHAGFSGAYAMQEVYYNMIQDMWTDPQIVQGAKCERDRIMQLNHAPGCAAWPSSNFTTSQIDYWNNYIQAQIAGVVASEVNNSEWGVTPRMIEAGWAGAAIWYNTIAQLNGEMSTAISNMPFGTQFPYVMEFIAAQNKAKNSSVSPDDMYDPALSGNSEVKYPRYRDRLIAADLYNAYHLWGSNDSNKTMVTQETGNVFIDYVNLIFGTQGIFSMRENYNIHPLAQLSTIGKGMMDASIRNIAVGTVGGGAAPFLKKFLGTEISGIIAATAKFLTTLGKATLVMSFVLYYVLPFMPFIYFFFAVSGWIKSIFEAIVAMPLWALAHISRLDGNGIAGPGATNGYFLLMEIFLRPILCLTGMLASISIYSALVFVLNQVFNLIVANLTGFDMQAENAAVGPSELQYYRMPIDKFFFTAIYVIICYMMALGLFKMIDQVPNNILRWMGVSVATFSEAAGDPAGELSGKVYSGGSLVLGQIQGGSGLAAFFSGSGSDRRLKENIVPMGQENGFNIYAFNYIGEDKIWIGVMADEVMLTHPEAVLEADGFLRVRYDRIGVEFRAA